MEWQLDLAIFHALCLHWNCLHIDLFGFVSPVPHQHTLQHCWWILCSLDWSWFVGDTFSSFPHLCCWPGPSSIEFTGYHTSFNCCCLVCPDVVSTSALVVITTPPLSSHSSAPVVLALRACVPSPSYVSSSSSMVVVCKSNLDRGFSSVVASWIALSHNESMLSIYQTHWWSFRLCFVFDMLLRSPFEPLSSTFRQKIHVNTTI